MGGRRARSVDNKDDRRAEKRSCSAHWNSLFRVGAGQVGVFGGDFTLNHDSTHPSTFLSQQGGATFLAVNIRVEHCDTLYRGLGGGGVNKIEIDSGVFTSSDGPLLVGTASVGDETTVIVRNTQVYATNPLATALTVSALTGGYQRYSFTGCDFTYSNISAILGNSHVSLTECRLNNAVLTAPANRRITDQASTY